MDNSNSENVLVIQTILQLFLSVMLNMSLQYHYELGHLPSSITNEIIGVVQRLLSSPSKNIEY